MTSDDTSFPTLFPLDPTSGDWPARLQKAAEEAKTSHQASVADDSKRAPADESTAPSSTDAVPHVKPTSAPADAAPSRGEDGVDTAGPKAYPKGSKLRILEAIDAHRTSEARKQMTIGDKLLGRLLLQQDAFSRFWGVAKFQLIASKLAGLKDGTSRVEDLDDLGHEMLYLTADAFARPAIIMSSLGPDHCFTFLPITAKAPANFDSFLHRDIKTSGPIVVVNKYVVNGRTVGQDFLSKVVTTE